jgi:hypothetical protein
MEIPRRNRRTAAVVAGVVVLSAGLSAAEAAKPKAPAGPAPAGPRAQEYAKGADFFAPPRDRAVRAFRVTYDSEAVSLDMEIEFLWRKLLRRELGGPVKAAGYSGLRTQRHSRRGIAGTSRCMEVVTLTGEAVGPEGTAERVLANLCKELREVLKARHRDHAADLQDRLVRTELELRKVRDSLEEVIKKQRKLTQEHGVTTFDAGELDKQIKLLNASQQSLLLELAAKRARLKALIGQIAAVTRKGRERAATDEIVRELVKIVRLQERALEMARETGKRRTISAAEVAAIEVKVAEAKVQLAERKEKVLTMVGGGLLARLNGELVTLQLDTTELEAKLAETNKQVDSLRKQRALAQVHGVALKSDVELAELLRRELVKKRATLKRMLLNYVPPSLTVIGLAKPAEPVKRPKSRPPSPRVE